MSNHTDFNTLRLHRDVSLRFADIKGELGQPDIIIIPGSKNTMHDLQSLYNTGMDKKIKKCHERGSTILGICGGFQMLGREIRDPMKVESDKESIPGLGMLQTVTEFKPDKFTTVTEGTDNIFYAKIRGYEIHMGITFTSEKEKPFISIDSRNGRKEKAQDGAVNSDMSVFGTYIHGIMDSSEFTRSFLNMVRKRKGLELINEVPEDYWNYKEKQYDKLAEIVRENIDMEKIYDILESGTDS
jgi:adenosylcobyric acid synthase